MGKGAVGNATLPAGPPGPELPQKLEELRRQDGESAGLHRDLLPARAAEAAGLFPGGSTPVILTQDNDGYGVVDSPTSTAIAQSQLAPAVGAAYRDWGLDNAQLNYSDERERTMTGTYGGPGAPADSQWRTGGDRLCYGDTAAPAPVFGGRAADPRHLDDPLYDARYDQVRPR